MTAVLPASGKSGDDTGWVRFKLPIVADPGQIQGAVDKLENCMNSHPPSNRLLLSLPPRNLKQLAPTLEFIRCQREQILLDVDVVDESLILDFPNAFFGGNFSIRFRRTDVSDERIYEIGQQPGQGIRAGFNDCLHSM